MAEVLKFSNNEETFYKLYSKRKESGDYIGALFAIKSYKNVATNKLKVYSAFAETYYLLNQYEKSAEYFFKFLAVLDETNSQLKSNYALAYAGLCALYYKVGNTMTKFCTFNLRINNAGDGINRFDNRFERIVDVIKREKPHVIGFQEGND